MERFTVTASFNRSNLPQTPTFQNTQLPPPYTSFPPKPHLRDASFSSFLRPDPSKSIPDDTEISIFDAERYFNENPDQKHSIKPPSVSINLERIVERCDISTVSRLSSVSSVDGYGRNYRTGSFHATPTASSEASWNSQTGLLSNPPGSIAVSIKNLPLNEQRKGQGHSRNWLFGRKCPCSGKKSVDVEEKLSESKSPIHFNSNSNGSLNQKKQSFEIEKKNKSFRATEEMAKLKLVSGTWAKDQKIVLRDSERFSPESELGRRIVPSGRPFGDAGFSFPILNPPPSATAGKLLMNGAKPAIPPEDPARESLEVFLPSDEMGVRKSAEFQRRMMMMVPIPGDNGRRSFSFPSSPKARAAVDDDMASDSSSDLFEIESFSTQTTMFRRRDSLDERFVGGGSSAGILHLRRSMDDTTTEGYEPSEVSVDWSVTTAEANFSTSASEYEEVRFGPAVALAKATALGGGGGGGKRKGNGLLSCRCEKAVSVGPHPVKCGSDQIRMGPTSETARIAAMSRLVKVGSAHVPKASDKATLARSHSARLSRPALTTTR